VGLLLVVVSLSIVAARVPLAKSSSLATARDSIAQTAALRQAIWHDAVDRIREAPWFGIGINQFHKVPYTYATIGPTVVPHAHNIGLQMALDVGLTGAIAYFALMVGVLAIAVRIARGGHLVAPLVAGAGLSLIAAHAFGIGDAIAMGAKVGIVEWLCVGLVLAGARLPSPRD
jgi:putative inorganic carbon (HCO3(-)) transporter